MPALSSITKTLPSEDHFAKVGKCHLRDEETEAENGTVGARFSVVSQHSAEPYQFAMTGSGPAVEI